MDLQTGLNSYQLIGDIIYALLMPIWNISNLSLCFFPIKGYVEVFIQIQVRFYPRDCKLDNTFANVVAIPSQIMLLNTFHNILIVLCADSHIMIFKMTRENDKSESIAS